MKSVPWLFFVLLLPGTNVAGAAAPLRTIEFHHTVQEALQGAKTSQPLVILFGANWCTWCRKMEADTLADPKLTTIAGRYLWVKVDVDKDPELAARYGVEGVPVTVVIDKQGRVLGAQSGYMPPDKFIKFLSTSLANPYPDELLPDLVDRFMNSRGPAAERETTARLVQQLAKPARVGRDEILVALGKKGSAAWPLLLELMTDDRLAVRAAAAGALKHASQAGLPFHPFADVGIRQQQIAGWQKWLASHRAKP